MKPAAVVTVALMSVVLVSFPVLASMQESAAILDIMAVHPMLRTTVWTPHFDTLRMLGAGLAVAIGTHAPPRFTVAIGATLTALGHVLVLSSANTELGGASVAFGGGMVIPAAYAAIGEAMAGFDAARLIPIVLTIGPATAADRWAWWARRWLAWMNPWWDWQKDAVSMSGVTVGLGAAAAVAALMALDRGPATPLREPASWRYILGVATIAGMATGAATFGFSLPDARDMETLIQWLPRAAALLTFGLGLGLAAFLHQVGARPPMLLAAGLGGTLAAIGIGLKYGTPIPEVLQVASALLAAGAGLTYAGVVATLADGRRLAIAPLALYLGAAPVAAGSVVNTLTDHLGTGTVLVAAALSAAAGVTLGVTSIASERPFDVPNDATDHVQA